MISYEYIQFINEKVLEYLPRDRVRIGDKVNVRCPLCGDSHKSAIKKRGWYYLQNASYYCFNCSTGMSGIRLLQVLSGQDYDEIKREYLRLFVKSGLNNDLSSRYETPSDEPDVFRLKQAVRPEWKKPLSEKARAYLDSRLVTSAPFFRDDMYSCQCRKGEYILIPWTVNGVEAYYQLNDYQRLGPIKYVFPKGMKKLVYGLDNVDLSWPYVICFEGVYDSLFVKNGIALGTKSITSYQMNLIGNRYPNHRICVSFDNDMPGIESMSKMIDRNDDVAFLKWFSPGMKAKDINEYVQETNDPKAFSDAKKLESMLESPL